MKLTEKELRDSHKLAIENSKKRLTEAQIKEVLVKTKKVSK